MSHRRFSRHYLREEARALIPELEKTLQQLRLLQARIDSNRKFTAPVQSGGLDAGGQSINDSVKWLSELRAVVTGLEKRTIFIRDIDTGLVDFPAIIGGREVFLCWESGQDDILFWRSIEEGSNRNRL